MAAVAAAVAAALINAVILLVNACSSLSQTYYRYHCHADRIASELSWWTLIVIVLGPVSVVAYECCRVKSGERSILGAWLRSVAGALVSSLVAYAVLVPPMVFYAIRRTLKA